MAIQTVNLGLIANDGTGDDLREAFTKVNANFAELDIRAANITAENVGIGGYGVFKEQVDTTLKFRNLQPDPEYPGTIGISVSEDGNTLFLRSAAATIRFTDGVNTLASSVEQVVTFTGTEAARITVDNNTRTVTVDSQLSRETAPAVSANLNINNNNITNINQINDITMDELAEVFSFNFGDITFTRSSIIDWLINSTDVDFGTVLASGAAPEIVDGGSITS
jgi:hypothetical protein